MDLDLAEDRFRITYDRRRTKPQAMLDVIRKEGFKGRIVTDPSRRERRPTSPHRDLSRLRIDSLTAAVEEAKRHNKPLLISFSAPG